MTHSHSAEPALLVLNPGSSSIKWSVHEQTELACYRGSGPLFSGQFKEDAEQGATVALAEAMAHCDVCSVVIRFVHGGAFYSEPLLVDNNNLKTLKGLVPLAPLHNKVAIDLIEQLQWAHSNPSFFSPPIVVVFDTEFFNDLPKVAQDYGLPASLVEKYRLRRYGFHGFAHHAMVDQWQILNPGKRDYTLVTAQLGSGCSMAAIKDGKPVDTTMGFTPNEGLLMRTRCGDLDPGLVTWLQRQENWSPEDTDAVLNKQSGWFGVSGGHDNMADLFASEDAKSQRAFELFRHRFQKTLGSYYAILGGLDGVVLSGGVAENSAEICHKLLSGLDHLGIELRPPGGRAELPRQLTEDTSAVKCWASFADEAAAMLSAVDRRFYINDNHELIRRDR